MKLLFLTDVLYPDSIGGANKYIYYLAKGLAKRGHEVFVLVHKARPELSDSGLVTLEAMSCGTPVLGTPAGATPETLDRFSNELVFEGTDSNAMSRLILEKYDLFRKDPLEYEKLREQCHSFSSKYYSWDRIVDRWEQEILDEL